MSNKELRFIWILMSSVIGGVSYVQGWHGCSYMYFNFPAHGAAVCSMDAQRVFMELSLLA